MIKYRSDIISEEDLKIETDSYYDEKEKNVEVVKLTMLSTNLEMKYRKWLLDK